MYYKKEAFPEHIKFVRNSDENRKRLTEKFGESTLWQDSMKNNAYIRVDLQEERWNPTFDFEWLYTNQPDLVDIKEIVG